MPNGQTLPYFDVKENICSRIGAGLATGVMHPFNFQTAEETFS